MKESARRRWFVPPLSIVVALLLSIVPLPASIAPWRPDWIAVVFLYWTLIEPRHYGLISAFCIGLVLDALSGSLLGQHSLALVIMVYLSQRSYLRVRAFPASQIAITVVILLAIYEFVLFWIDGIADRELPLVEHWGPVVTGGVLSLFMLTSRERGRRVAEARM